MDHAASARSAGRRRGPSTAAHRCVLLRSQWEPGATENLRGQAGEDEDDGVESIDILFNDAEPPPATISMKPNLAALAITLEYAVRFRYQLLEPFAGRKLELKDVVDFQSRRNALLGRALRDRRFEDRSKIREMTISAFVGEDKAVIQKMYERSDQLWRQDEDGEDKGEMVRAIDKAKNGDTEALEGLIKELLGMIQSFLTVTSKRFAELIAGS